MDSQHEFGDKRKEAIQEFKDKTDACDPIITKFFNELPEDYEAMVFIKDANARHVMNAATMDLGDQMKTLIHYMLAVTKQSGQSMDDLLGAIKALDNNDTVRLEGRDNV